MRRRHHPIRNLIILALVIFALVKIGPDNLNRTLDNGVRGFQMFVHKYRTTPAFEVQQSASSSAESSESSATSSSSSAKGATDDATPIESVVQGIKLSNTYHYTFASGTTQQVRDLFARAVAVYNKTGVVYLDPGQGTKYQNTITFGQYRTVSPQGQQAEELGKAGPRVYQYSGGENFTVNRAEAKLNIQYADKLDDTTALHELGHALGIDHSTNEHSIMYPYDEANQQLTAADVNTLREIYARTSE